MAEKMKNPEAYDVIATEGKATTMDANWVEPTPGTDEYKKWVSEGRPRPNEVSLIDKNGGVVKAEPDKVKINPKTGMTYEEEKLFKEMQQEAKGYKPCRNMRSKSTCQSGLSCTITLTSRTECVAGT